MPEIMTNVASLFSLNLTGFLDRVEVSGELSSLPSPS